MSCYKDISENSYGSLFCLYRKLVTLPSANNHLTDPSYRINRCHDTRVHFRTYNGGGGQSPRNQIIVIVYQQINERGTDDFPFCSHTRGLRYPTQNFDNSHYSNHNQFNPGRLLTNPIDFITTVTTTNISGMHFLIPVILHRPTNNFIHYGCST